MPILDWVGFTEARRENFARRGRRRRHTVLPLHSDRALPAHSFGISQSASGVIVSSEAANVSSSRLSLESLTWPPAAACRRYIEPECRQQCAVILHSQWGTELACLSKTAIAQPKGQCKSKLIIIAIQRPLPTQQPQPE